MVARCSAQAAPRELGLRARRAGRGGGADAESPWAVSGPSASCPPAAAAPGAAAARTLRQRAALWYLRLAVKCDALVAHPYFVVFVTVIILIAGVMVGVDTCDCFDDGCTAARYAADVANPLCDHADTYGRATTPDGPDTYGGGWVARDGDKAGWPEGAGGEPRYPHPHCNCVMDLPETVSLCHATYWKMRGFLEGLDVFVLLVFIAEIFLKIVALDFAPWRFFTAGVVTWNNFDFVIVLGSLETIGIDIGLPGGSMLKMLRLLRLLRVLKLVKSLPQLAVIINAMIMGLGSIGYASGSIFSLSLPFRGFSRL